MGASAKQTVQSAYARLFPNAKNKDLFESIDEKEIEKNIPLAESVVKKNMASHPLGRDTFKNHPYMTDGLALFYAAAESGNHTAANEARKLAYTEVKEPEKSKEEDLRKTSEEEKAKKEKPKYRGLDALSDILSLASFIPGIDTFTNLAPIPVDLLRGDFVSAGLSALGAIPFVGEVADTAKLAKTADKIADVAKGADKAIDAAKAADKAVDAAKISGTIIQETKKGFALKSVDKLPSNIQKSTKSFFKGSSNNYNNYLTIKNMDNTYTIIMENPGKVPGSKAVYYKIVDSEGKTIKVYKDTFDPAGKLVHRKDK